MTLTVLVGFISAQTRRLVIGSALLVTLAVPIEAVLVAAMRVPDASVAAHTWAAGLPAESLQDAALHIQSYPYFYRRAIMSALEPEARSQTWRRYLVSYTSTHPDLNVAARALLSRAASAMTPDVFDDNPPPDRVAELANIFDLGITVFGRRTATDLFMRLGPDDGGFAALPVMERVTSHVRNFITLHASPGDCDCASIFPTSCDISGATGDACTETSGCEPVIRWPMCGVAWAAPCNGACTTSSHRK